MKYADAVSFRTSLEARLNAAAAASDMISVGRLRKLVTLERFLARLLEAAPDRWVLKGGVALELRLHDRARATKDLDLWMRENEESATSDLLRASLVDLQDYFGFSIERTGSINIDHEDAAIRYRLRAELAGRQFETVVVDVGFGGTLDREPDLLTGSGHLAFAGIEPIQVPALPLDFHVAEKLHAYTRHYGGSFNSSRVKDLIDLVIITAVAEFGAGELRHALSSTFASRGSQALPTHLSSPPEEWLAAYQKLAMEVDLDPDVTVGHLTAANFLDPVLTGGVHDNSRWDPVSGEWREVESQPLDRASIQLDDEAFSRFSDMLDAPAAPSDALRDLLHRKAPWE